MHPMIENHRDAIAALCRRYGVRRLELFGSALREDFDTDKSDVDVIVEFDQETSGSGLRRYFDLKAHLESLFERPVDVVELGAMEDTRLKRIIQRTKVPLYAAPA